MRSLGRHVVLGLLALGTIAMPAVAQAQAAKYPASPAVTPPVVVRPGKLVVATNATLPPVQYIDEKGNLQGMRIELGNEIAKRLGLEINWVNIQFDAQIPGLQGGRWDLIVTGLFFTPERAKLMYLIPYELQAISISVPKGNPKKLLQQSDLAGRPVAVEIGGYEERQIRRINDEQVKAGAKPMDIKTFNTFAESYQALRAGQVEAVVSVDAVAKFYQDKGEFERAMSGIAGSPATVAAKSKDLAQAVVKVMNDMKADGYYDALFDRYGVSKVAGKTLELKGPDLP
ncbi:MAG TPA: ABC transporter substrate-binding protein [Candidatus Acidoferrales bacterium]|nr:ABC transporter substrate-binding protein [Candidatus Acidoferrales bacterium]